MLSGKTRNGWWYKWSILSNTEGSFAVLLPSVSSWYEWRQKFCKQKTAKQLTPTMYTKQLIRNREKIRSTGTGLENNKICNNAFLSGGVWFTWRGTVNAQNDTSAPKIKFLVHGVYLHICSEQAQHRRSNVFERNKCRPSGCTDCDTVRVINRAKRLGNPKMKESYRKKTANIKKRGALLVVGTHLLRVWSLRRSCRSALYEIQQFSGLRRLRVQ
jgi:hypothetical protein